MTKAGMKTPEKGKTGNKRYQPYEPPKISTVEPEPDSGNLLKRLMESDESRLTEPIISLDSRTEFDGRESWEKDRGDRGILKLYNVYNDDNTLKLELKEVNEDGSEISRCNAKIDSIKLKYDFLSQIRSTDSTKRGYGTNLLYLLAKARNDEIVHNGINYNEITIRDFLPVIFNPFRNLFHLSVTLWSEKFKISSPQFTLFEPFYREELSGVVYILYNHENTEEDSLEKEIETLKEEKIRLLAEMENLRKRFEREKVETIKFGSINLARDILSPGDNLERALDALPEDENHPESIKNLIDGLKMVLKEYKSTLEKHGVKKIETLNKKFDHNFHQAMMEVENNDVEEGTVVQEVQSGYTMHDRLLRAAMVGVSKKPVAKKEEPTEEKEEDNPENESKEKS